MDITHPAATFTATRDELLGSEPLAASAEIARQICRGADRTVSVLAITAVRMRRIDGWLGDVGFVTHAAAPDTARPLLGSVCDRDRSPSLLRLVVDALVGGMPERAAVDPLVMSALCATTPATIPDGVEWVAVLSAASIDDTPARLVAAGAGGLVAGPVVALDEPVVLAPVEPILLDDRLAGLVEARPRSIRDLLFGD